MDILCEKYIYIYILNTIECLCLGTISLINAPQKFDVFKTSKFALEALLLRQNLFQEHQISAGQLSANSSLTETLYCLKSSSKTGEV